MAVLSSTLLKIKKGSAFSQNNHNTALIRRWPKVLDVILASKAEWIVSYKAETNLQEIRIAAGFKKP